MGVIDIIFIVVFVIAAVLLCIAVNKMNKKDNMFYGSMCGGCPFPPEKVVEQYKKRNIPDNVENDDNKKGNT